MSLFKVGRSSGVLSLAALRDNPDRLLKDPNPSALGVIVSDGYGYVREDGISVIPIGALGP